MWLKSQADETLPITPIGRTPERREIADTQFHGQAGASSHPVLGQPSTPSTSCSGENALPNKGSVLQFILTVRQVSVGATYRPKSPSHKRFTPRGVTHPLILKHLYNTEKPWRVPKNALGLLLFFQISSWLENKKSPTIPRQLVHPQHHKNIFSEELEKK